MVKDSFVVAEMARRSSHIDYAAATNSTNAPQPSDGATQTDAPRGSNGTPDVPLNSLAFEALSPGARALEKVLARYR